MDIRLHIVAPAERREKVFSEIRRPVFSLLEKGPLADSCTYLSYESVRISAHRGRPFQPNVDGISAERGRHFRLIVDDVSA
jgi:hypothetical protein